jgi:L-seryl-tRNA(Ser) seleniumtransferase
MGDERRGLPAVGALLELAGIRRLIETYPRSLVSDAVRQSIASVRDGARPPASEDEWAALVALKVVGLDRRSLIPVLNGTGVVLHTNLGRAPLAQAAIDAIEATARGYTNLEYDLEGGGRGSRYTHCAALLRELTGAEDALVVNNCAGALVLALNTFADGREAVVSRGELIEIGGSFRVPDIMAKSGARLREVGTTNRTHLDDYRSALGGSTGALVKVHRSNFELVGFAASTSLRELRDLARAPGLPLLFDFGSGLLVSLESVGLRGEPTAGDAVRDGATVTVMSGDKLMGGPQAGVLIGTREAIARCRANPLTRALRVDKLTLAALEATLRLYRDPSRALQEIPTLRMLATPAAALRDRAERLWAALPAEHQAGAAVEATEATVGGGAFPAARIPSFGISLAGDAIALDRALRGLSTPVVGHIVDDRLVIDLRTIGPESDAAVGRGLVIARNAFGR